MVLIYKKSSGYRIRKANKFSSYLQNEKPELNPSVWDKDISEDTTLVRIYIRDKFGVDHGFISVDNNGRLILELNRNSRHISSVANCIRKFELLDIK